MSKDDSNDSLPGWKKKEEMEHILDSLKPKDPKSDLDSYFKLPAPLKPGWVPCQTKDNFDPSLTTKKLIPRYPRDWIGQCTVPANIVAYCKETFGQDVKLTFD